MAVGDGGFKQVAFGFDKNEVNTYISDLRKKMRAMEEDMKANDKKTAEAEKLAEEADERIKAAVKEGEDKNAELEKQLSDTQKKLDKTEEDLKKLKKDLEDERRKMSDMLLSGKGVNAEASKAYNEIINKANADADAIIDDANAKAADIIRKANENCADVNAKTNEFLDTVKAQIEALTAGFNTINASAAELLGAEVAEIKPVKLDAPVKAAPVAAPVVEETVIEELVAPAEEAAPESEPEPEPEPVKEEEPVEIKASTDTMEINSGSDDMPAITEADKAGQDLASFDDVWGGSELAQTIYNDEKKNAVPLVNPEVKDLFGKDLFGTTEDIDIDLNGAFNQPDEDAVTEVKPLDVSDVADPAFDNSFDNDLLAQTLPSGSMEGLNDELLEAVKAAEEAFAVQPTSPDLSELDMDEHEEAPAINTEDELMKALREAEEALNSLAPPASDATNDDTVITSDSSAGSDPWADLQKQFEAMEKSGNFGAAEEPAAAPAAEDPAAPSADDSAIWNFGDTSSEASSDDDDMSGDMFGGFGGF